MNLRAATLLLALSCAVACTTVHRAHAAVTTETRDVVEPMLHRIDAFLHRGETDGVTRDPRKLQNPPEEIRLTVVPQLLAYCELYRVVPSAAHYDDIVARADFLTQHFETISSRTAADGMLGYALLSAYEITGDPRYRIPAVTIVQRSLGLTGLGLKLNWGLMAAMALAKYHQLEGDPVALDKAREIVRGVARLQNRDGSLPHVCEASKDVHYTAWMSMELILLHSLTSDPLIPQILNGTYGFMRGRVSVDGVTSYQDPPEPGYTACFYGPANGCQGDYDTRAWVNELGYGALLFDRFADPRSQAVMERLLRLEDRGAFPDKWDYFPAPTDPIYPWAVGTRSVIRTSLVFWSLATLYTDQDQQGAARYIASQAAPVLPVVDAEAGEMVSVTAALGNGFPFSADGVFMGEAIPDTVPAGPSAVDAPAGAAHTVAAPAAGAPATATDAAASAASPVAEPSASAEGRLASSTGRSEATPVQHLDLALVSPGAARGTASIRFSLSEQDQVSLRIYDVAGRAVRELWRGVAGQGEHRVVWDGRDDAGGGARSGLYFVRLMTREGTRSVRLLWLR